MNLLTLVVFVSLGTFVASKSTCPHDDRFYFYCMCEPDRFAIVDPELIVQCHGLHDSDIADILSRLKGQHVNLLKLEQIKISSFKKEYVKDLHIRELVVDNSPLTSFEDGALGVITGLHALFVIKTRIQKLPDQTNAIDLQQLSLEFHDVTEIGPENFPKNSKLDTLEIDAGSLTKIKDGTFLSLKYLKHLSLENNFVSTLPKLLTAANSNVSDINLAHNHLENFPAGIFKNEKHLRELNLEANLIQSVSVVPFKQLLQRGTSLFLGDNLLGCDKSLCWLADLIKTSDISNLLHGNCSSRDMGKSLGQLDATELGC